VLVIRIENGTWYLKTTFGVFLSEQDILHQTFFPYTTPQNGVAEQNNRQVLEVARSLMYTMNVPSSYGVKES
jgi:hypothetical protein